MVFVSVHYSGVAQQISAVPVNGVGVPLIHPHVQPQPAGPVVTSQAMGASRTSAAPAGRPAGSKQKPWSGMSAAVLQLAVSVHAFPTFASAEVALQYAAPRLI